ncbi:coiled-coil domain-containing protein 97 [Holotrichia oblita]|uniref:Coiled-coil domain-containing protein 97 n=1 Tax=Holotrichia oblita TaxID=644536 RepID=A0ACB9T9W6_HOLOL|nr:coiled-coil domain-containing protein 97 [Holotrichia oblita]
MEVDENDPLINIFHYLIQNKNICFKNQQRDEADITDEEKITIAKDIYNKSKPAFLLRFGTFMTKEQLEMFTPNSMDSEEDEEIRLILANLTRSYSEKTNVLKTKNRRYEALKQLIDKKSYFSEVEMMKRNPLLYEQLVGQYLNEEERRERDRRENNNTLVKILMEAVERDEAFDRKKKQQEAEDDAMEESDSDEDENVKEKISAPPKPSTSRWGEYPEMQDTPISKYGLITKNQKFITQQERQLLRDEFISIMYANFLNGQDDFDYATVDNNDAYDNIDILGHDEEDKYFDSEEPADATTDKNAEAESSEDELDMYMNALNQHPTVIKLSQDLENL